MEKFGYIVSKTKISDLKGCVEQVDDISLADLAKPILIVGYKEAKKIASEEDKEFDILNKSLDKNLFWTFKKTESIFIKVNCVTYHKVLFAIVSIRIRIFLSGLLHEFTANTT